MILAREPGTVGWGHGSAAVCALVPPNPAPPDVAVALGVLVHWLGPCVGPVKLVYVVCVEVGCDVEPALAPLLDDMPPPPELALAAVGPASANAAKLGSIR